MAVDEILGAVQGLNSLLLLLDGLKKRNLLDKTYLFWFDASLFSGQVAETLLKLQRKGLIIQQHFHKARYCESWKFEIDGVEVEAFFSPSFPAKELFVEHKTYPISIESKKDTNKLVKDLTNLIVEELKDEKAKKGMAVFIQNIELAKGVAKALNEREFKAKVATAYQTIDLSNLEESVVIFTSALSRGVDLPFTKLVIFVPSFSVENNLAETLQAIYRIRDGKNDEQTSKKVVFFYPKPLFVPKDLKEIKKFEMYAMAGLVDQLIEAYTCPKEERRYFIPIPVIKNAYYRQTFSEFVEIGRFLQSEREVKLVVEIENAFVKKIKAEYPFLYFFNTQTAFKLYLTEGGKRLTDNQIEKLKESVFQKENIPIEKRERILAFLSNFQKGEFRPIANADLVFYLPNLVMPELKISTSTISCKGYQIDTEPLKVKSEVLQNFMEMSDDKLPYYPIYLMHSNIDENGKLLSFPTIPLFLFG